MVRLTLFAEIRVSVKFFVKICFRLYERRAGPPLWDLAINYPRFLPGGLGILHINVFGTIGPPKRAQPRTQALLLGARQLAGGKTLVQAGHVVIINYFVLGEGRSKETRLI